MCVLLAPLTQVLPEVQARQAEEAAAREAARRAVAEAIASGKKLPHQQLLEESSDEEEVPDLEIKARTAVTDRFLKPGTCFLPHCSVDALLNAFLTLFVHPQREC